MWYEKYISNHILIILILLIFRNIISYKLFSQIKMNEQKVSKY